MALNLINGSGNSLGLGALASQGRNNAVTLAAGQYELVPAGQWIIIPGPYTFVQVKDPVSGRWLVANQTPNQAGWWSSDGVNLRLANLTGCAVGAFLTNVGSGYTSAPTVTASTGGSTWVATIGKGISSTITITTAGAGYNYPPQLAIDAPPAGGTQATATCTISSGAINAVTVVNQGSGYTSVPTVTVIPDPRDAVASTPGPTTTAVLTAALLTSGTVNSVICTNHGTPVTSVPTLTFAGGGGSSAAATAVMCFTVTGFTVTTAGSTYGNAQPFAIVTTGGIVGGSAGSVVNPLLGPGMFIPRQANISGTTTAGGAIQTTGSVINDGGLFQAVPTGAVLPAGSAIPSTTIAQVAMTVGGVTDTSWLQPFE